MVITTGALVGTLVVTTAASVRLALGLMLLLGALLRTTVGAVDGSEEIDGTALGDDVVVGTELGERAPSRETTSKWGRRTAASTAFRGHRRTR